MRKYLRDVQSGKLDDFKRQCSKKGTGKKHPNFFQLLHHCPSAFYSELFNAMEGAESLNEAIRRRTRITEIDKRISSFVAMGGP